ncbi:MAG TPA: phage portal protein, partial [Anaerolineae bacterium]|nr:phage portal protein [Anaerolineae bacterium]
NANSMRVLTYTDEDGPTSFEQRSGSRRRVFQADELIYFRSFDPAEDIREGIAPGQVGRKPAALVDAINNYSGSFFENGAIPAVLLTTDGAIPPNKRDRVLSAWNKLLQGVRRAFSTVILERGLTPTIIGQPNTDLAMPELDESKRDQILAAHLLPPGLAKSVTSRAERDALKAEAYEECYIPECETWIEPTLNEQLFNPLSLRISYQYREIEVLQKQELEKAEASSYFVTGMMLPAYKENLVSIAEVRAVVDAVLEASALPPLDENFEPEERTPPQLRPFTGEQPQEEGDDIEGAPATVEERIENRIPKSMDADLDRWERKAITRIKEGFPAKALEFASDTIPAVMHRMIVHGLEHAATLGDVAEVFKAARGESKQIHFIPEGQGDPLPPVPDEVTISEADIDRALKDWNKHMPDFAGLLDAEVIHRENYDNA